MINKSDPHQFRAWWLHRWPQFGVQVEVAEIVRQIVIQWIFLIDVITPKPEVVKEGGKLFFDLTKFGAGIGKDPRWLSGLALNWELSMGVRLLRWRHTGSCGSLQPWISFGGLILTVLSVQPHDLREPDHLKWLAQAQTLLQNLSGAGIDLTVPDQLDALLLFRG